MQHIIYIKQKLGLWKVNSDTFSYFQGIVKARFSTKSMTKTKSKIILHYFRYINLLVLKKNVDCLFDEAVVY